MILERIFDIIMELEQHSNHQPPAEESEMFQAWYSISHSRTVLVLRDPYHQECSSQRVRG